MILEKMSSELLLPFSNTERLVLTASYQYKAYAIKKRNGKDRIIHQPSRRLKALQRWLLTNVIASWPVHPAAMAYRQGRSIFDNARVHAESMYLLRMDMQDFFHSITVDDMRAYMEKRKSLFDGWTPTDQDGFRNLVLRHGRLTIGAPTSPAISNALCFDLDSALANIGLDHGVAYTRYADDLFFSSRKQNVLKEVEEQVHLQVSNLTIPAGLKINPKKTTHSSKRGARRVTGIVLGSDGNAYVSRKTKRCVRALVRNVDKLDPGTRAKLAGLIAYVSGFEPSFVNSLILKYGPEKVEKARKKPAI